MADGKDVTEVEWDDTFICEFCNYLYEIVDFDRCLELEKNIRIETGTSDRLQISKYHQNVNRCDAQRNGRSAASAKNLSTYKFKKDDDDIVGEMLDDEREEDTIRKNIPYITEKAFIVYSNVVKKAKEGNECIDLKTENFLRTDIFRIVLTKCIINNVRKKLKELYCKNTKDIAGLANPLQIRDDSLDMITNETMCDLMNKGVAVQNNFIGKSVMESIYKELEFVEFSNQFNEFDKSCKDIRTDFYCWTYINNLDRERQKGLYKLLKTLALLPFELNKKANLYLQMCSLFQFSYFSPNKSYLKRHAQGGYDKLDNGKKITLIYIPFVHPEEKVQLKVYKHNNTESFMYTEMETEKNLGLSENGAAEQTNNTKEENESPILVLKPKSDSLIFLQTRNTTYEISKTTHKLFVINFWISGPVSSDKKI